MTPPLIVTAESHVVPYVVTLRDQSGHEWRADEAAESGGSNAGPNPQQLILSALGACTAIAVRMYAAHKSWPLVGVEVTLELNPVGAPLAGNDIRRRITLRGELTSEQRERLLEIANRCPIHEVLTGEVRVESSVTDWGGASFGLQRGDRRRAQELPSP